MIHPLRRLINGKPSFIRRLLDELNVTTILASIRIIYEAARQSTNNVEE